MTSVTANDASVDLSILDRPKGKMLLPYLHALANTANKQKVA